jgi:hypothetical protein
MTWEQLLSPSPWLSLWLTGLLCLVILVFDRVFGRRS